MRRAERREVEVRLRQAQGDKERLNALRATNAVGTVDVEHANSEVDAQEARLLAKDAQVKEAELRLKQAERRLAPRYSVVEALGPPHRRTFHVEVSWDGGCVRAEGRSIKSAEAAAAKEALTFMRAGEKEA